MRKYLSETAIVRTVAKYAARRITQRTITKLQGIKITLSGDDSELKSTWDEICVQMQQEYFFSWNAYETTVHGILEGCIEDLPQHEMESLWLQTDPGIDWQCEEPDDREPYPICTDDIIFYLADEYIYTEAGRWSNSRIRSFIERGEMSD